MFLRTDFECVVQFVVLAGAEEIEQPFSAVLGVQRHQLVVVGTGVVQLNLLLDDTMEILVLQLLMVFQLRHNILHGNFLDVCNEQIDGTRCIEKHERKDAILDGGEEVESLNEIEYVRSLQLQIHTEGPVLLSIQQI